ncbi:TetR/AcrR family transcriptional regulator [Cohnella nanjingensis]|uniref:TetR/AcrR family transcriptional regulator n=1 Tax=Cohnella nanjingensis TaxID=1387779 RepID=A0A7X0VDY0_9BACL|nr:TetR/AcrR family transcriptional regulator [Cohnella nanjingensis]MBB6670420.1 TetR/AcrR family transcriptional regulator [Cohnella nanjingensis]
MEDWRKDKILDVAMDLFRQKGYSATSMQDIAEACGMAKASIYKLFASKEELFTEVFVLCHQVLLAKAAELDRSGALLGLSPKEMLVRKIEFQLYYTLENHIFMMDLKELPLTGNELFVAAWKRKKSALLNWMKDLMLDKYGEPIEPYIWDVVTVFRGILIEYMRFALQKVISLPMADLAAFIVDRMDAVVGDLIRMRPRPVIDDAIARFNYLNPSDEQRRHGTAREFLREMESRILGMTLPEAVRREMAEVVGLIRKELELEQPNATLLRVLIVYFEAIPELKSDIRQLKLLLS